VERPADGVQNIPQRKFRRAPGWIEMKRGLPRRRQPRNSVVKTELKMSSREKFGKRCPVF